MYNIADLNAMTESELKGIAESMGMKKVDALSQEDLVYKILDQQAEDIVAASAVEKKKKASKEPKTPKNNEPKKKKKQPAQQPVAELSAPVAQDLTADGAETVQSQPLTEPPRRRRGRPSKEQLAAEAAALQNQPKDQDATDEKVEPVVEPERELPPHVEVVDDNDHRDIMTLVAPLPATEVTVSGEEPSATDEPKAVEEQAQEQELPVDENQPVAPQQGKKRDFRPGKDSSFGSFFRTERKFVPRSQREKEEAAAAAAIAAATAPIVIREPGQEPAPQSNNNQGGKKNKRNRNNNNNNNNQPQPVQEPPMPQYNFDGILMATGVLEVMPDGYGFLRSSDYNYLSSPDDVYVTQAQIKLYGLKTGDVVDGWIRPPKEGEKYFPLSSVQSVNGRSPEFIRDRVPFEHLTPLFPDEKFDLTGGRTCNLSTRVVDMFSPIGKGR